MQSKLIGEVECILVDDSKEKKEVATKNMQISVPDGLHHRQDVFWVMKKVGEKAGEILQKRTSELEKHEPLV